MASVTGTGTTVKNLTNGTAYSFKVTAVNKAGEGPASGAASATPTAKVTKPGLPNGLTASPGNGKVTLSWTAPGSDGGTGISGYEIYRGTSPGGESGTPVNASLVAGTSYTVTGLTNGTRYYFTVAAVNQAKLQGAKSGEASATPAARRRLGLGERIGVGERASHGVTVQRSHGHGDRHSGSTDRPDRDPGQRRGGPVVDRARLGRRRAASQLSRLPREPAPASRLGTPVTSTSDTHTTVTGLTNGTTYYFVVTAVDGSGTVSGASGEASAQPLATAVLASATTSVPKPVIVSLAAVAAAAIAAAGALTARRLRKRPRKRPPAAPPADVRAVPEMGPPSPVNLHEITSHVSAAENDLP